MIQNRIVKLILTGFVFCILTHALMFFIDRYVLTILGEWIYDIFGQYLIYHWTELDRFIMKWFPLFMVGIYVLLGIKSVTQFIKTFFWTVSFIFVSLGLAVFVALFAWTNNGGDSALLPAYLRYQPFANYWTLFISVGILLPLIPLWVHKKRESNPNQLID